MRKMDGGKFSLLRIFLRPFFSSTILSTIS